MVEKENPLHNPRYPRSNEYDPEWVFENQMGPNALWLMEALTEGLLSVNDQLLTAGTKVLDLGAGKAMTSIFLAKEFGVQVWATDLWIGATENQERIRAAGVEDLVYPIHAEAHSLPFANQFFDLIVSADAYQYFGTDDLYLGYITRFLRHGGRIAAVMPAVFEELGTAVPERLAPYWDWEFCCFHGPQWWRTHWKKTQKVTVERADALDEGWKDWLDFTEACLPRVSGWRKEAASNEVAMLRIDQGELLGFTRIIGRKPE
ncbi:MAG: methyltransferase domain-containing protein [Acidimicrobiales bacterium]